MIFSSYEFLLAFLPICLGCYFLLGRLKGSEVARWWLVACSLVFMAWGTGWFTLVFLGSVTFNYFTGTWLGALRTQKRGGGKTLLTLGILANVSLLVYYKYTDFFISNVNSLLHTDWNLMNIVLPLGISFITFQKIAYLVDSYRGETVGYRPLDYIMFVSFFPQLIVGPIVHHREVVPQFADPDLAKPNWTNLSTGIFIFTIGLAKKLFLADPLTIPAQAALADPSQLTFYTAWLHVLSFTISYYFDLSSYADMAIGLGKMFNITLPENFDSPYRARNFAEYWRRWHMTLSRFLGDYIFRSVFQRGQGAARFYFAVFLTFLVSGFWHGAGWNFVLWGIVNGVFVMMAHAMTRAKKSLPFWLAWLLTFGGVVLLRVLFISQDLGQSWQIYQTLFTPHWNGFGVFVLTNRVQGAVLAASMLIVWFAPQTKVLVLRVTRNAILAVVLATVWGGVLLTANKVAPFLYFQF